MELPATYSLWIQDGIEAVYFDRPNRFLARVKVGDTLLSVHCPNPGRMHELLVPGERVILEDSLSRRSGDADSNRKTRYSLAGVYHRDRVVPLDTSRINGLAENLVLPRLFPSLISLEREVAMDGSRFDFRLRFHDHNLIVEVKCCTLVEEATALFPDAPTLRGTKHLEALARNSRAGGHSACLFMIMQPDAAVFMPNIHTDPVFSKTLLQAAREVQLFAASVNTDRNGMARVENLHVPIDLGCAGRHLRDGGSYLLILEIETERVIHAGSLGVVPIKRGYYVYVGSAMGNLERRLERHRRKSKKQHWHIDYLRPAAQKIREFPIRSARRLECSLAGGLQSIAGGSVPGFGCSDCACPSHLFYFPMPPMKSRPFISLLDSFRHREAFRPAC